MVSKGREEVVLARNLSKRYGKNAAAVNGFSISIRRGEIFGLLGRNGSGKTTIVRLLTGQIRPTGGSASILGTDPEKDPIAVREKVGIMPEQETPPSFLTCKEYLEFVCKIRKLPDSSERAQKWLEFFSMQGEAGMLCKDLSRGGRQKLMFAQAFIHEPKVAFIDEPLINLDPLVQKKVREFLKNYSREGGTVFFCTHVLSVAEDICTRYAIIDSGRILKTGTLRRRTGSLEAIFSRLFRA